MHGGHFHPRVKQEDAGCQNEVVEIAHVRHQLVPAHIQQDRVAACPIAQAQQDQDGSGNNGSDDGSPFGDACGSLHAAQIKQGCRPVHAQHHDENIPLLAASASSHLCPGPMKARETAANVRTVGNQMVLSIHCSQMARNPHFSRKPRLPSGKRRLFEAIR